MPEPVARLIEDRPERPGPTHELGLGTFVLGRSAGADLFLDHVDVSRQHAELEVTAHSAMVRDLGSKNGVRVDGRKVSDAVLEDGSRFSFGELSLILEHPGARVDRLLQRSGEPTVRRPHSSVEQQAAAGPSPRDRASLLGPILAAVGFALLLTLLLVYG